MAGQTLGIRESSRDGRLYLTTLKAAYQWQADEDDGTWLVVMNFDKDRDEQQKPALDAYRKAKQTQK